MLETIDSSALLENQAFCGVNIGCLYSLDVESNSTCLLCTYIELRLLDLPRKIPPASHPTSAPTPEHRSTMSDAEDGLLAIALSDSDDQPGETDANPKDSRTGQSVQAFEAVKKSYKAKVEGGEVRCDLPRVAGRLFLPT